MDKKFLPSFDRAYLDEKLYSYKEVNEGARNGLIITDFKVPEGKYTGLVPDPFLCPSSEGSL